MLMLDGQIRDNCQEKRCSFVHGFTSTFGSTLAMHCNFFLAENPSGDKVLVTIANRVICNLRVQVTQDQGLTSFLYHESCASTRRPDLIGLWMLRCLVDCRFLDLG